MNNHINKACILKNLGSETLKRWQFGTFLEHNKIPYTEESSYLKSISSDMPWVPYENYMFAKLISIIPNETGLLHIRFPPEMAENSRLHRHLYSDRLITVIEGSGTFLVNRFKGLVENIELSVGDRLWMPRCVVHTFISGAYGLTLESIHNPFIEFNDAKVLSYEIENDRALLLNTA